jgi:hypothetical protein
MVLAALGGVVLLWFISRMMDSQPYLFNDGKLGYLEKQSPYVKNKKI